MSCRRCSCQPEVHAHRAVNRRSGGQVLVGLRSVARSLVELAEAEVAVGDEGAHAELGGERQGLPIVFVSEIGATRRRHVTGKAEGVGLAPPSPQPAAERQGLFGVACGRPDPPGLEAGHPRA